jgi:hypothetical protein
MFEVVGLGWKNDGAAVSTGYAEGICRNRRLTKETNAIFI